MFFACFSQNNSSNSKIKKIIETQTYEVTSSDNKRYVYTSEINEYNYNIKGQEISNLAKTYYNKKPYRTTQTNYFYNKEDQIDYTDNFNLKDSIRYKVNYFYTSNKLVKKSAYYIINEKEINYNEKYSYDKDGKLTKSNYLYLEKYLDSYIGQRDLNALFTYNKKEQLIESDWTKSDSSYKYNRIVHFRNRKGRITKEKEYDKNGNLIKTNIYKYIFDSKNNWTILKCYEKKSLVKSIYREIEYFD